MTAEPVPPAPTQPGVRSAEELNHFLGWLPTSWYANRPGPSDDDYLFGMLTCVEWVLGRRHESPVRCRYSDEPPTRSGIHHEHQAAHEAMRDGVDQVRREYHLRREDTLAFNRTYFTACEHTLYWALGHDGGISLPEDWPWPESVR